MEVQSRWEILSDMWFKMHPLELEGGGVSSLYGKQQKH